MVAQFLYCKGGVNYDVTKDPSKTTMIHHQLEGNGLCVVMVQRSTRLGRINF